MSIRHSLYYPLLIVLMCSIACAEADTQSSDRINAGKSTSTSTATSTSTQTNPSSCEEVCQDQATTCMGDNLSVCELNESGCLVWKVQEECATTGQVCDQAAGSCAPPAAHCSDQRKSGDETDIDCGGSCASCGEGLRCLEGTDCTSLTCSDQNVCVLPMEGGTCKNEGATQCGSTGIETCQSGAWVETQACANGCKNLTCITDTPCNDGQTQCDGSTPQTCVSGAWVSGQACPQACDMGACVQAVTCTAGESRCLGPLVQKCNPTGSAWNLSTVCQDRCEAGLCVGTCQPSQLRCNGNQQEECQPDGKSWMATQTCANGCDQRVCIEMGYTNSGLDETREGVEVVKGCWTIELGGRVTVPEGKTLEVYADCIKITDSGVLVIDGGEASFFAKTIEIDGSVAAAKKLTFKASDTLRFGGTARGSTAEVWLWANKLQIEAGSDITPARRVYALYGESIDNKGAMPEVTSVMPPFELNSSTHPSGFNWNWTQDNFYFSWPRPFPGAIGYYVSVGNAQPDPQTATLTTQESISLPADQFEHGRNRIKVVSVNAANQLGEQTAEFSFYVNKRPMSVSSASHSDSNEWNPKDDVFMQWTNPSGLLGSGQTAPSWAGYAWVWSEYGDATVDIKTALSQNVVQKIFPDQPLGEQHFHMVSIDRLGRPSPAARYTVRIGPEPERSNLAGNVVDEVTMMPIENVEVSIEADLLKVKTGTTGDFTFQGEVYVRTSPYNVKFSAPGYEDRQLSIPITSSTTVTRMVKLKPKP